MTYWILISTHLDENCTSSRPCLVGRLGVGFLPKDKTLWLSLKSRLESRRHQTLYSRGCENISKFLQTRLGCLQMISWLLIIFKTFILGYLLEYFKWPFLVSLPYRSWETPEPTPYEDSHRMKEASSNIISGRLLLEYGSMKHAEQVPVSELLKLPGHTFYMPVHSVVKESSTTTRLRAVFDASAKTSSGASLNDQLLAGPTLHPPLTAIITRFRSHKIAVSSDISKMLRGVLLHPEEKDFHRFMVRTKDRAIEDWRMCRLTFGVKSSPFLTTQKLQQATSLHSSKFPLASKANLDSFYVDDCLTGASTLQEAQDIQQQLCALFSEISMLIRK